MQIERGVVRLGAEIEVAQWANGRTYKDVAQDLLFAGYMIGGEEVWKKWHNYHCDCRKGGCDIVRRGTIVDPPIVSMTYDATLPAEGAEFIMSPVLMWDQGMPHFERIWEIVTKNAKWVNNIKDQKGRMTSPSVHLHVSATLKERKSTRSNFSEEILHALSLFAPEFFALADTAGLRRGLAYRLPDRESILNVPGGVHHGFVQVRRAVQNEFMHIEWRLFEAAYESFGYVQSAAYLAAGLTRALLKDYVFSELMTTGYAHPHSSQALRDAVANDDTNGVLEQVDPARLEALREMIITHLDDDDFAANQVAELFAQVGV